MFENMKRANENEMQAKHSVNETKDERIKFLENEIEEAHSAKQRLKYEIDGMN